METTRDYKIELESMQYLTVEDMQAAMRLIASNLRDKLSKGPKGYRYHCGVCESLCGKNIIPDPNDPLYIVWIYHELPKAYFKHANDNYYGSGANEIYKRCIETYRAAGWTGEALEPNA